MKRPNATSAESEHAAFECGFFVLRTPLLPFDDFLSWGSALEAPTVLQDTIRLGAALAADRHTLRMRLRRLIERPLVREALYVASPSFYESLRDWSADAAESRDGRTERALVSYFTRMSSRPTPFGLFAGCSVGSVAVGTRLRIGGHDTYRRHTRLDADYLSVLLQALERDRETRNALVYRPNSSLYEAAGGFHYAEARLDGPVRTYRLVALQSTDYLDATLRRASEGMRPQELAAALVDADAEVPLAEARRFVEELIESQVLVSDLEVPVTGPEPASIVVAQLRELPTAAKAAEQLDLVQKELSALDATGLGCETVRYGTIAHLLQELPARIDPARLFQVDMVKPVSSAVLGHAVIEEIQRGVRCLYRCCSGPDPLAQFRRRFLERYGTREVPLVEALDEELGIGLEPLDAPSAEASPLLEGLPFPRTDDEGEVTSWHQREALLLRKLQTALRVGATEIELDERDIESLEGQTQSPLPDAFCAIATIAAASEAEVAAGRFRVHVGVASGPSGAFLLGRFCHADGLLEAAVRRHINSEEALRPGAVFAEIVHLPEGRIGNILFRPKLRKHEIPYLGRSGASPEWQIPITDLLVSAVGDRIVVRSRRLASQVIPRLTSAHNFGGPGLGVYKFLCRLQTQGVAPAATWGWGPLSSAAFLPRVVTGRVVLSLARWNLDADHVRMLAETQGAERFRVVQSLRSDLRLPRVVALAEGDSLLPVDLDNVLSVDAFVSMVRRREDVTLVELFPAPENLLVRGPEGRFVHELIVPFVRSGGSVPLAPAPNSNRSASSGRSLRAFPPGSEWLYVKLYMGPSTCDHALYLLGSTIETALTAGWTDRWFFIRYGDPHWHVRLRFHGDPDQLSTRLLPALRDVLIPLLEDGRLWRMQIDTYEREVERYGGGEGIALAERLFHVDSVAALTILGASSGDEGLDARWRLALRGIDTLLDDLGLSFNEKCSAISRSRHVLGKRVGLEHGLKRGLAEKFRKERVSLEALVDTEVQGEGRLEIGLRALQKRSAEVDPLALELRALEDEGRLSVSVGNLAGSFVHMHVNRMLRSAAAAEEFVLYDLLDRLYRTQAARHPTKN